MASMSARSACWPISRRSGKEFPQDGKLYDQMQLQGIVDVASDGKTAKGRWHMFAQEAEHGKYARWGLGVYENDYVKQDGVWKIAKSPSLYDDVRAL